MRIDKVEPLELLASRQHQSLRIFLRESSAIESIGRQLEAKGEGDVSFVLLLGTQEQREVEVKLPGRYRVSPQITGALKAMPGVIQVQIV